MVPADLIVLWETEGLPVLPDPEIALLRSRTAVPAAATRLSEYVLTALDRRHALQSAAAQRRTCGDR